MGLAAILAMSAFCGFCAKFADEVADRKLPAAEGYAAALLYGILAGLLVASGQLSSLFLAMAAATMLAGKFDHRLHFAGLITFGIMLLVFPLQAFSPFLFSFFLVAALLDELELKIRPVAMFADRRLLLPLCALIAAIWTSELLFLFAILFFDSGYIFSGKATEMLFRPHAARMRPRKRGK